MKIDAHQHFWHYEPHKQAWINDEMAVIRKDFLPQDLQPVLEANGIDGTVAVQADETEMETGFLTGLSQQYSFIKAVVGWTDLRAENINERLEYYSGFSVIKGFRHVLQAQEPSFMLQPAFIRGLAALQAFDYTYDLLLLPGHIPSAIELVRRFPGQRFVLDHLAKPFIKMGLINEWKHDIQLLASSPNVYCKISGMVTEADYNNWKQEDFLPYLDVVVQAFGPKRIMFGSDWPVCLVAADYSKMMSIAEHYFSSFSDSEQADVFGNNAIAFYQL